MNARSLPPGWDKRLTDATMLQPLAELTPQPSEGIRWAQS